MAFCEVHKNFLCWRQCQVFQENKCFREQTLFPSSSFWHTRIPIIISVNMVPATDSVSFIKKFVLISHQNPARGDGISPWYNSLTKPLTLLAAQQDISDILKTHKLTQPPYKQDTKVLVNWMQTKSQHTYNCQSYTIVAKSICLAKTLTYYNEMYKAINSRLY